MLRMAVDWFTNLPTTLAVLVSVAGGGGASALGLLLVHHVLPHGVRAEHNEVAGFTSATVGVIYAVLLAYVAVTVSQNFAVTDNQVQVEANLVGDLYRATVAFPEPSASQLRHYLFVYAETVMKDEWPALASGRIEEAAGWQLLDKFHVELLQLRGSDATVSAVRAEVIRMLDQLYDARRARFHAATEELPAILWWNLIAGAVMLVSYNFLFGATRLWMHVVMVGALGGLIGLVMALVVLLDHPFRGQNHVSIAPFQRMVQSVEEMAFPRQ